MEKTFDVVQIGYGPVGQLNACLLGKAGHRVAVVERHDGIYGLPRAGHLDHEIMRILQGAGVAENLEPRLVRAGPYVFRNQHDEEIARYDWGGMSVSGWWKDYFMYQPDLEELLDAEVRSLPNVEILHGWEAADLVQDSNHVDLTIHERSGQRTRSVRGRYLVGTDGGNGFLRPALGIPLIDLGFQERWYVVDYRLRAPHEFDFDNGQICDPARPSNLFRLGHHHRRFAFMVLPHETTEEMETEQKAWELLAEHGIGPDIAEIIRRTVYVFESKYAETWRQDRCILAGDSAHVMPPFMGQGLCSGLRDVANLAWRLDRVLRDESSEQLLDGYEEERLPHVVHIIENSIEAGRLTVTTDHELAAARDRAYRTGTAPAPRPFPRLTTGILHRDDHGEPVGLAGTLAPQAVVEWDGERGRFDDVVARGWVLLVNDAALLPLPPRLQEVSAAAGVRIVSLADPRLRAIDSGYADYFSLNGVGAILYRPDYYVYGAAEDPSGLETLLLDAAASLRNTE